MKRKFIIILNLLLGAALFGGVTLHPYTVSAETAEIETDSDDLEGVEYDSADQNGVLLDIDIVPDEYDRKHYDAALKIPMTVNRYCRCILIIHQIRTS